MENNKQKTAVGWLAETMDYLIPSDKELLILQIVKKAKEMEKQQIIEACEYGIYDMDAEEYYNEQFKNK
jgi:uncharacterized membrane-anchored protein YitT (DUF2179 family)